MKEAELEKDLVEFIVLDLHNKIENQESPAPGVVADYNRGLDLVNELERLIKVRQKIIKDCVKDLNDNQEEEQQWINQNQEEEKAFC